MQHGDTRDQLLETGLQLMHRHGYGATGLKELLDSAGITKGSFYHHFGSKEDFAAEVLQRYSELGLKHCQQFLSDGRRSPLKRVRLYFEDLLKLYGQAAPIPGCLIGSFSLEVAATSDTIQKRLSTVLAVWQGVLADVLRQAAEKGELDASTNPTQLAAFLLNSWEGALGRSLAEKSDEPLETFLHFAFSVLLKGTKKPKKR